MQVTTRNPKNADTVSDVPMLLDGPNLTWSEQRRSR